MDSGHDVLCDTALRTAHLSCMHASKTKSSACCVWSTESGWRTESAVIRALPAGCTAP